MTEHRTYAKAKVNTNDKRRVSFMESTDGNSLNATAEERFNMDVIWLLLIN